MTTTEVAPNKSRSNGVEPSFSDQVVLSGAGLLSNSVERTRANVDAALDIVDELVLGTFTIVDDVNAIAADLVPQLLPALTAKPAQLARQAYVTASAAVRRSVHNL